MDFSGKMIDLVKLNDLKSLEALCRDLLEVNTHCKGYALLDYDACIDSMLGHALEANVSIELFIRIYLSGVNPSAAKNILLTAFAKEKYAYAEALIASGARITEVTQKLAQYENLSVRNKALLKAHCAWHDAIAIVKSTTSLQRIARSNIKALQTSLQECANAAPEVLGEYVNRITQGRESNLLSLVEWNDVKTAISGFRFNCEKIEASDFANYTHPEMFANLSPVYKKQVEIKVTQMIAPLMETMKDEIQQELIWYFRTPESLNPPREIAEKMVRVKTLLDSKRCLFNFYLQNPLQLLTGNAKLNESTLLIAYFRDACVRAIMPNVKNTVLPNTGLPGLFEAKKAKLPLLVNAWTNVVFTNTYDPNGDPEGDVVKVINSVAQVLTAMTAKPSLEAIWILPTYAYDIQSALLRAIENNFARVVEALLPILDPHASMQKPLQAAIDAKSAKIFGLLLTHPKSLNVDANILLKRAIASLKYLIIEQLLNKPGFKIDENIFLAGHGFFRSGNSEKDKLEYEIESLFNVYKSRPKIATLEALIEKLFSKNFINDVLNTKSLKQFTLTFPLQCPDAVIQLVQLNEQIKNKWFFQSETDFKNTFVQIAKQDPEILVEFTKCIVVKGVENPFTLSQWQLWVKLFSNVSDKLKDEIKKYCHPEHLPIFAEKISLFRSASSNSNIVAPLTTKVESQLADKIKADFNKAFQNSKLSDQDYQALQALCLTSTPLIATEFQNHQELLMHARILLNENGSKIETILATPKEYAQVEDDQIYLAKRFLQVCLQQELQQHQVNRANMTMGVSNGSN